MQKSIYLIITPFFPLPGHWWGGYVFDQVKAIKNTGQFEDVVVLRTMRIGKSYDYECEGIKVYGLPALSMPSNILTGNPIQKWLNNILLQTTINRLKLKLENIKYVHLHTYNTAIYAEYLKSHGCVVLLQHHDLNPYGINFGIFAEKKWSINYIGRKSIAHFSYVDCHLCISEACRINLTHFPQIREGEIYKNYIAKLKKYNGPEPVIHDTYILHNGVDRSLFKPTVSDRGNDKFTIGCIGGFSEIKNQITLIKAIEYIVSVIGEKNIHLRLIGTGPLLKDVKNYIVANNLSNYITFDPTCDHKSLVAFYNSIDLFCLPSFFEGMGCVFTEAYSCGVPFIGCRYQGIEDYIPEELKDKFLLNNPLDYIELSKKIISYIRNRYDFYLIRDFDISVIINKYCTWLIDKY